MQFDIDRRGLPPEDPLPPPVADLVNSIVRAIEPTVVGVPRHAVAFALVTAVGRLLTQFAKPGFAGEALALAAAQIRREAEKIGPLHEVH